jgi:ribosomal protein L20A (L18A)
MNSPSICAAAGGLIGATYAFTTGKNNTRIITRARRMNPVKCSNFVNLALQMSGCAAPARLSRVCESPISMKAYRVTGIAPFGSMRQEFSLDLPAGSKADAEHRTYSIMGSRHKANRRSITINSVSEIDPRTSTEPRVTHHFRDQIAAAGGAVTPVAEEE